MASFVDLHSSSSGSEDGQLEAFNPTNLRVRRGRSPVQHSSHNRLHTRDTLPIPSCYSVAFLVKCKRKYDVVNLSTEGASVIFKQLFEPVDREPVDRVINGWHNRSRPAASPRKLFEDHFCKLLDLAHSFSALSSIV